MRPRTKFQPSIAPGGPQSSPWLSAGENRSPPARTANRTPAPNPGFAKTPKYIGRWRQSSFRNYWGKHHPEEGLAFAVSGSPNTSAAAGSTRPPDRPPAAVTRLADTAPLPRQE